MTLSSFRYSRTGPVATVLVALSLCAFPVRADAQLGGLLKKAKEKIIAPEQPSAAATKVEQVGDPFDESSLTATIAGLKVMAARQADIAALDKQSNDLGNSANALLDKNKKAIEDYHKNESAISNCISADMESRSGAREAAVQSKMMENMSDPKFMAEMTRIQTALQQALAKGDTASQRKLTIQFQKFTGLVDDSLPSFKKCGRLPAMPAAMVEADRLGKQRQAMIDKMRLIQSSSEVDAAKAANTSPAKFQKQKERLVTYQSDKKPFSPQERALISGRMTEIAPLIK